MLTLPAPAKLNLMLHIVGRRPDGYHSLQTLFQLLDSGDVLTLEARPGPDIELSCTTPELATADNLVMRAARALQAYTKCQSGARLHLDKRLPFGGGLGGGSSDCATALLGLNHLWSLNLSVDVLASIGLSLGADVPVFVRGHSAWAEGIGEVLTPVEMPEHWFVVVNPSIHVSTATLFGHPQLTRHTPVSTIRSALAGAGHNDFEPLVRALYPAIDRAFRELNELSNGTADTVRLSGSGSSMFIKTQSDMAAQQILRSIRDQYPGYSAFIAQGVNQSPLQRTLATQA
ncbi:4-(cytidine 5'-diphospho)-2-C-methyl-D-erythritol kinase [Saccharospirillum impatiens]|uniref:4-(cytidine 5'-diphospho)-2-C-methyl-D-erythritol kinase n=1 Tax=Saccharospirillum impatiens TaxID=169438 RepID=UPI0003FBE1D0|nr:4-(cytidine 5'-diphospho)-2-C-methyl-D-erythritol kinase [Saccharospirillum impatiens]